MRRFVLMVALCALTAPAAGADIVERATYCWNVPAGTPDDARDTFTVRLAQDGKVENIKQADPKTGTPFAESAAMALLRCGPYDERGQVTVTMRPPPPDDRLLLPR